MLDGFSFASPLAFIEGEPKIGAGGGEILCIYWY
jgi:hypothetical protein